MLLEISSEAKDKHVLQGKPQRNWGKPATALRSSGPLSNDRAGWCDQPEPKSSGSSGFLPDIFAHSCSQHLVTSRMQKWSVLRVHSHYRVD